MSDTLKVIRDVTIIIAIYLYFIAWAYIHFYYRQFGISTDTIKIDYNSYLMYSYNVLTSQRFSNWAFSMLLLVILLAVIFLLVRWLTHKYKRLQKVKNKIVDNPLWLYLKNHNLQGTLLLFLLISVIVFPQLFKISRAVAIDSYQKDRQNPNLLKAVQFVFRNKAELLSPSMVLDSALSKTNYFYNDISLLKNDNQQLLRLLGENDKCYIVLQQRPYNGAVGLPTGYIYFVNKDDVLLTKIILRSFINSEK